MRKSLLIVLLLFLGSAYAQSSMFGFDEDSYKNDTKAPALEPTGGSTETPPPPQTPPPADDKTEAGFIVECENCKAKNIKDLQAIVNGKLRLGDLTTWRRARGMVQIPTEGPKHFEGLCHTTHYEPTSPPFDRQGYPTDNYLTPLAACVMASAFQDWLKSDNCKDNTKGCRIFFGDGSNKDRERFNGHSTHTQGHCMDFRPMRTGSARNTGLNIYSGDYDRETTRAFIKMMYKKGADIIYFNDRKIQASRAGGHDNHVHVCFRPNKVAKDTCKNFTYDPKVCE